MGTASCFQNAMWKGGRTITSHGYVLVLVGKSHHVADCRGSAYEHRLVAEAKLGRRLEPQEEIHHIDGDMLNNDPDNLEVLSRAHHKFVHRNAGCNRKLPDEENYLVKCACGCGTTIRKFDDYGRRRRFVSGHNARKSRGGSNG